MAIGNDVNLYQNLANVSTESRILDIIIRARSGITRAEIARLTRFSKSTISQHVETLLNNRLVVEQMDASGIGRPAQKLYLNADHGYLIGVDLGGSSLNIGLCNLNAESVDAISDIEVDIAAGPSVVMSQIECAVNELVKRNDIREEELLAIGMGAPGPVDYATGTLVLPPIMPGWDGFSVKQYLEEHLGLRAFVSNDVDVIALAEYWKGAAGQCQNFLFIKLGVGIGCGIFCDGKLYRGATGCAGDIGHIGVEGSMVACSCGNTGCLEKLAGSNAIVAKVIEMGKSGQSTYIQSLLEKSEKITYKTIRAAIFKGDQAVIDYVHTVGGYVGEVLAKVINFYNPSMVVFGGGIATFGDVLLTPIREKVYGRSVALATRDLLIRRSALDETSGYIGAAILAREEIFKPLAFSQNGLEVVSKK